MYRAQAFGDHFKPTTSALDEAKDLYEKQFRATHASGKFEFMKGLRDLQDRGGFGLDGGSQMLERLQTVADGGRILDLNQTATVDQLLEQLILFLPSKDCHLTSIDLRKTRVTIDGLIHLALSLRQSPKIQSLRLTEQELPIQQLRDSPVALDFSKKGYNALDAAVIGTMLDQDQYLEFLNLSENELLGRKGIILTGFTVLANALATKQSVLTTLILRKIHLKSDGLVQLTKVLSVGKHLKEIDLSENPIALDGFDNRSYFGINALVSVMRRDCSIETLTLRQTELDCNSIQELARLLGGNQHLKSFDVSENRLTDVGIRALAMELKPNGGLQTLRLSNVEMKRRGCVELATVFEKYNYTLTALDISHNDQIGRLGRDHLSQALHENPSILSIRLPEKEKNTREEKHIRGLARANKERLVAMENLESYDFEKMNESCLTNFIYKLNYLQDDMMKLLLKNTSFQRRRITSDKTLCLRHYSNTGSTRLARNLLRVLDYTERRQKIQDLLHRYDSIPEIDQPEYWNIDL